MPVLSYEQIVQAARAGGLPGDADMWAAVAMAESSGRTDVVNPIGCVGLWQINQPVWVKSHPSWTKEWLKNPVNNARAAAVVYRAQGMKAWEAYTGPDGTGSDGPWRQYYRGARGGATAASWDPFEDFWNGLLGEPKRGPGSEGWDEDPFGILPDVQTDLGIGDVAKGVGAIAEAVQKTAVWLGDSRNWVRVGYVTGGAVLVVMGLSIVARPLLNATPGGAMVKKATKSMTTKTKRAPAKTAAAQKGSGE